MTAAAPFAYPPVPHSRLHGPSGYKDYGDYKPFLRDEFSFRCVYCLEREVWYPNRAGSFSIDHFTPKVIDPSQASDYENLVLACVRCNSFKQAYVIFLNPTKVAFADHFRVKPDGHIEGLSTEARDLIDLLHLDEEPALEVRRQVMNIARLKAKYKSDDLVDKVFVSKFRYPGDLPDLSSLKPPGSNSRPGGIQSSHFARRQKGLLPETY